MDQGTLASQNFHADYAELLLSFDQRATFNALVAWCRTDGARMASPKDDADALQVLLEMGFVHLYNRKAIEPVRPFSSRGQEQLNFLQKTYRVSSPAQRAASLSIDPLDAFVEEYPIMPSAEFKKRYTEDAHFKALYEQAIATGRI